MLLIAGHGHPVLFPDRAKAGQFSGDVLAYLHGRGTKTARKPVGSSISNCARGGRRQIVYFTRLRVVDT
jgi:hypothetical protein